MEVKEINIELADLYEPLFSTDARYIHLWGGRGRGGSFTGTQYFIHLLTCPQYFRGYIMREVFNDVRESLWRDLKDRIEENETLDEYDFEMNESSMTLKYKPTGNVIIAKGFKKSSSNRTAKLKSLAGATHVLIEEFDEIGEPDFMQLDDSLRTVKGNIQVLCIFNPPPKSHWIWKRWYILKDSKKLPGFFEAQPKRDPSLVSIHSTYRDNLDNLNKSFINNLATYKTTDPDYYGIMVEGLISEGAKGRIYKNWESCKEIPAHLEKFYGIDFGFNDPLAVVELAIEGKNLYVNEVLLTQGMLNSELSTKLAQWPVRKSARMWADSAGAIHIEELKRLGWNVHSVGLKDVVAGIKKVKEYNVIVTERSKNIWTAYENYAWALDQYKNPTDHPNHFWSDLMDAIRYGVVGRQKPIGVSIILPGANKITTQRRTI